ncbi:T9SS type A sorting domain-containing protein [Hymenobacter sp. M29]|uniref:T9SS type A sorting domain-containing protein n=1 Tax=Hymenobacter mellowenesis TaxID=3063995 RepID=A0ABT9ALM6_9BACT|nr:T9SS type A sorting domain-containing protein [Hymenobacter sp. M29]MDO7849937.1 T9SS type A sorting domain-containing protein [Hymenobacter sp. M29]
MKTFTVRFAQLALVALSSVAFGPRAAAQTAPAWTSARGTGAYLSPYTRRVTDAQGNVYEAATFNPQTGVGRTTLTSRGSYDGYLAKYTPLGAVAWVRQFGSTGSDGADDMALDAAGNVYVVGHFQGTIDMGSGQNLSAGNNYAGSKAFVARYDAQGNLAWAKQSDNVANDPAYPACPPVVLATGVTVDGAGNVFVTGGHVYSRGISFDGQLVVPSTTVAAPYTTYLARFSAATGDVQSINNIFYSDRSTGAGVIYPLRLVSAPGGGVYVVTNLYMAASFPAGPTFPSPSSVNLMAMKYNAAGTLEWARTFGGPDFDDITGAAADAAGNLYLTGTFRQSFSFGGSTLAGATATAGTEDGFLLRFSAQGTEEWARSLVSAGSDFLTAVCVDGGGNAYVTGSFGNQARLGTLTLTSAGRSDLLVASYSPQGQLRWVQQAGGPDDERGLGLSFLAQGGLQVYGYACYGVAFGAIALPGQGSYLGFIAQLDASATTLAAATARPLPQGLFPNPASDGVYLPGLAPGTLVQVVDATGRVARTATVSAAAAVSVRGLAPGLYVLRITDRQGQTYAARVAVE